MSRITEKYRQQGYEFYTMKSHLPYLAEIFLEAAREINELLLKRNSETGGIEEVIGIFDRFSIPPSAKFSDLPQFPYIPLWPAVMEYSGKKIQCLSELGEEIQNIRHDLAEILDQSSDTREKLRKFCADVSRKLMDDSSGTRYLRRQV